MFTLSRASSLVCVLSIAGWRAVAGQSAAPDPAGVVEPAVLSSTGAPAASWSFGVGESFEYVVGLGPVKAGHATLSVEARESVAGIPTHRVVLHVQAGLVFFRADDRYESWIAAGPLRSVRVEQRVEEGTRRRRDRFELDYEAGCVRALAWDERTGGYVPAPEERGCSSLSGPALDEVGFLYLLRTLPVEPGRTHRFDSHFLPDGNPVLFRVLGREEVRVPAGEFETIVVAPVLPGMAIFSTDADARLYVSDDPRRLLVKVTTSTKLGTLSLHLRRYEPGAAVKGRLARP